MFFPEFLYQLTARDQQVTWLDPTLRADSTSAAAASVSSTIFTIPQGQVLILLNAMCRGTPGGAQFVARTRIDVLPPAASNNFFLASDDTIGGAGLSLSVTWTGEVLIPATWQLRGVADFNAGAVANTIEFHFMGILIPAANIQRV